MDIFRFVTAKMKKHAQESGHSCDMPECEYLTFGFTCEDCNRRLCNAHLYFKSQTPPTPPVALCPYCIIDRHDELFADDEDEEDY